MFDPVGLRVWHRRDEGTTHKVAEGRSVEAHVYSVQQDDAVFKLTVAELADTGLGESAVIVRAIKKISDDRLHRRYFNVDDGSRDAEQGSPGG
jgi:hypothetical protein